MRGNLHVLNIMSKYSFFTPDYTLARRYYLNEEMSKYTSIFLSCVQRTFNQAGVEYTLEKDNDSIKISTKNISIDLTLNDEDQIVRANVWGIGQLMFDIRESIWNTKTFFGVPVLSVLNTSFDDSSIWEFHPRQFLVTMMPKELSVLF